MNRLAVVALLALAVTASAVSVVHVKHRSRTLFVELQILERERDRLNVEWNQLALEQSAWGTHDRVAELATSRLGFEEPKATTMEVVSSHGR
ncbi:MAG: cell division protein FtsL [Gammaproteobacteria bacterium]|nr:cell division protein FtsL [Gammaproteobacteria bacterium]